MSKQAQPSPVTTKKNSYICISRSLGERCKYDKQSMQILLTESINRSRATRIESVNHSYHREKYGKVVATQTDFDFKSGKFQQTLYLVHPFANPLFAHDIMKSVFDISKKFKQTDACCGSDQLRPLLLHLSHTHIRRLLRD